MKKKIGVSILLCLVISFVFLAFTSCLKSESTDVDITKDNEKQVPVYQGMTVSNPSDSTATASALACFGRTESLSSTVCYNDNHQVHYKGDHTGKDEKIDKDNPFSENGSDKNIESEIDSYINIVGTSKEIYYSEVGENIYINIHISNPDNYEILSFTINGQKFSSYMFEDGSDMETIIIKYNVGKTSGITQYTIDAIKYVDGESIKDVIIGGNQTVMVGVHSENQITATISKFEISSNSVAINATISDGDNLIPFSEGNLKAIIYDGNKILATQDLNVGANSFYFDNLKTNTIYQYAIVGCYDNLTGNGIALNVIYMDVFRTNAIVLFDDVVVGTRGLTFDFWWYQENEANSISALKLYKGEELVSSFDTSVREINGLLSNNEYKLIAEYSNNSTTESVCIEFSTLSNEIPALEVEGIGNTKDSISFAVNISDTDRVGKITKIELINGENIVTADDISVRSFSNLLSNTTYTVRVTYSYDLNEGNGVESITSSCQIKTTVRSIPSVSISNLSCNNNSIAFDINTTDTSNTITKIEASILVGGSVVETKECTHSCSFNNLEYSCTYTVNLTIYYDMSDGAGMKSKSVSNEITTPDYTDEQGITYKMNSDETAEVVKFTGDASELIIPESVAGHTVTSIADNAFLNKKITSIYIPATVKTIGASAFKNCYYLNTVTLNEGLEEIKSYAFNSCNNIQKLVIPLSVSVIEQYAFYTHSSIYSHWEANNNLYIKAKSAPDGWDSSFGCSICQRMIWDFNEFVEHEDILYAICNNKTAEVVCATKLRQSIIIPDTVQDCTITGIGPYAFKSVYFDKHISGCIQLPNNLIYIDKYAFSRVGAYTSVVFPATLEKIGTGAFSNSLITSIEFNSNCINIGSEAFHGCYDLIELYIPLNATGYISERAFSDCDSLKFVNIPYDMIVYNNSFTDCDTVKFCCLADRRPSSWGDEWEDGIPVEWSSYVDPTGVVYKINENIMYDGHPTMTITDFWNENLYDVYVPEKVLGRLVWMVGEEAFWDTDVISVYLPATVQVLAERAFDDSITVYYEYGSELYNGWRMFGIYGNFLYTILDNGEAEIFEYMPNFENKYELLTDYYDEETYTHYELFVKKIDNTETSKHLTIPAEVDGYKVINIKNNAFDYLSKITEVTISDGITAIGSYAFSNCINLIAINIPASVNNIENRAFWNCEKLLNILVDDNNKIYTSVDGNLYTKDGKTLINYAIGKTDASFVIPDGVTNIGNDAFYNCSALTQVVIPSSVTSIDDSAFEGCKLLTNIEIPESVAFIGNHVFSRCSGLTFNSWEGCIYLGNEQNPYYALIDTEGNYESFTIHTDTVVIAGGAFSGCNKLTAITIPNKVIGIGNNAFGYCYSLVSISIPESVKIIGDSVFRDCTSLESIVIPNGVTSIEYSAFYNCSALTNIIIPDSVTSIGYGAFYNCSALTNIIIPDSVTSIGDSAFYNCSALTNIIIPDSVKIIGRSAFCCCSLLKSVTIGEGVTIIETYTFDSCSALESITLPTGLTTIGYYAFSGCGSLENVVLPDSVEKIDNGAFNRCSSLTNITIPAGVTYIGQSSFSNCTNLASATFENTAGWKATHSLYSSVKLNNLSNAETAAKYLIETYKNYTWKRS